MTRFQNFYRRSFSKGHAGQRRWILNLPAIFKFPPDSFSLSRKKGADIAEGWNVISSWRRVTEVSVPRWMELERGQKFFSFEKREKPFLTIIENDRLLPSWKFALIVRNFPTLRVVYNGTKWVRPFYYFFFFFPRRGCVHPILNLDPRNFEIRYPSVEWK